MALWASVDSLIASSPQTTMNMNATMTVQGPGPEDRMLQHLVASGKLDAEGSERARRLVLQGGHSLTRILLELGLVPEKDLVAAFEAVLGIPVASSEDFPLEPVLPDAVTERFQREHAVVILSADASTVTIAAADPADPFLVSAIGLSTGRKVALKAALSSDIEQALRRLYAREDDAALQAQSGDLAAEATEADLARLRESASEAPVIRFVNALISKAVEAGASDIHIEPFERRLRIRVRIDGVLKEEEPAAIELAPAVISRLKIMSGLNIAERRLPQDGAMKLPVRGKEVDFRIATAPVAHGECAVVRILDKSSVPLDFRTLGFDAQAEARLDQLLRKPNGIVLVTGPTGSGKTTTLYASLARLNSSERKILSVEDPVEYKIPGINQIQVKPEIGLTFANVLRSVLRHDPDVILVGEIRDAETARIAVQAALTGHTVLSTVHTNSAAAAITRLLDMGVEDFLLTSTISGIISQRLVRTLCRDCRQPTDMRAEWADEFRAAGLDVPTGTVMYGASGCASCNGTGFRGRSVISEILVPNEEIRKLTLQRSSASAIHAAAVAGGMETLRRNGLRKVLEGATTIEEISRVAQEEL
jgi:general secretion pathway protein E